MADRSSRHDRAPTYRWSRDGGEGVELFRPRVVPSTAGRVRHTVASGDRLDLLAARYLGDTHLYWRIVDANPALDADAPLEPGIVLEIPTRSP